MLRYRLEALRYALAASAETATLTVARGLDTDLVERVRRGHRARVIVEDGGSQWLRTDGPPSLMPVPYDMNQAFPGLFAQARDNTILRGDWITAFRWLARIGIFAGIPGPSDTSPMSDLSFERVVRHLLLVGMKPWEHEAHVAARLVVGWGHRASAIVAER